MYLGSLRYLYFPCNVQAHNCSHLWFFGPCQEFCWVIVAETWSPKLLISALPLLLQGSTEGQTAGPFPTLSAGLTLLNLGFEPVSEMAITGLGGVHFANIHGVDFKSVEINLNFYDGWKFILLLGLNWPSSRVGSRRLFPSVIWAQDCGGVFH